VCGLVRASALRSLIRMRPLVRFQLAPQKGPLAYSFVALRAACVRCVVVLATSLPYRQRSDCTACSERGPATLVRIEGDVGAWDLITVKAWLIEAPSR
jgi:hypothetical protein